MNLILDFPYRMVSANFLSVYHNTVCNYIYLLKIVCSIAFPI